MIINNIFGISSVTTSINIPDEFNIEFMSTEKQNSLIYDSNYRITQDNNFINSMIELDIIPYIDFNKYDNDRRSFFHTDKYGNIWRKYIPGDFILETEQIATEIRYYSIYNLFKMKQDFLQEAVDAVMIADLQILPYKPIILMVNSEELLDVTDYTFNSVPTLNFINIDKNKQFYFKNNKLYTNINFTLYKIENIDISYYKTINSVNVTCVMDANASNYSNYTPIVDYYILKLTGQSF